MLSDRNRAGLKVPSRGRPVTTARNSMIGLVGPMAKPSRRGIPARLSSIFDSRTSGREPETSKFPRKPTTPRSDRAYKSVCQTEPDPHNRQFTTFA